jgi:hypothetical protein
MIARLLVFKVRQILQEQSGVFFLSGTLDLMGESEWNRI